MGEVPQIGKCGPADRHLIGPVGRLHRGLRRSS
jgi:hypothetical protein